MEDAINIRNAKETDIKGITEVSRRSQRTSQESGLIQQRTESEFCKLLGIARHFLVAEKGATIAGYIIILDESANYNENEIFSFYPLHYQGFVFVDQIAVHPAYRRAGIARKLYETCVKSEHKRILLDILISPRNQDSIAFHEAIGFAPLGDIIHLKNGMEAEVYEYKKKN